MKDSIFIFDTSVLLFITQLHLESLFKEILYHLNGKGVLLPPVRQELLTVDPDILVDSLQLIEATPAPIKELPEDLGVGERAVIEFVLNEKNRKAIAVLDDFRARKVGRQLGIQLTGTLGLLSRGYELCPIQSKEILLEIFKKGVELGFYLPQKIDEFVEGLQKD